MRSQRIEWGAWVGDHMAVGYVLINVSPGAELEVYNTIKELPMVEDATLLFGDYDILVKMSAETMSEIAAGVVQQVRSIKGVVNTKTLAGAEL
jgi:DNA-binding Lrp family transcriptional regulator